VSFIRAGRSFTAPGPGPNQAHLWIVLTDPDSTDDKIVAVMVVSEKPHTDKTVTLNIGDHPFFKHTSNIDYGTAKHFPRVKLEKQINATGKLREDISLPILEKARAGVLGSSRCPNYIKEYFASRFDKTGKPFRESAPEQGSRDEDSS
jgi:hypothetical protein